MIQNNDTLMMEKIQTSITNTIPLWKNQMVLTLGIQDSQRHGGTAEGHGYDQPAAAKNADMLKMATVETAREAERGIVDIETLKHTNESLISTLDEVLQIQTDGAKKRQEAEQELRRIEGELKQKLLETRKRLSMKEFFQKKSVAITITLVVIALAVVIGAVSAPKGAQTQSSASLSADASGWAKKNYAQYEDFLDDDADLF